MRPKNNKIRWNDETDPYHYHRDIDGLNGCRGFFVGFLLSALIWALVGLFIFNAI